VANDLEGNGEIPGWDLILSTMRKKSVPDFDKMR
jgi:hypothetical protein